MSERARGNRGSGRVSSGPAPGSDALSPEHRAQSLSGARVGALQGVCGIGGGAGFPSGASAGLGLGRGLGRVGDR